jgi:hypothetical protein
MFKIYGVTDTASTAKKSAHTPHHETDDHHHDEHTHSDHDHHETEHHTSGHHHTIEVDIHDDADHETDIGQIAVDILDTTSSIVIIAPIA